jgi:hypothetical protein
MDNTRPNDESNKGEKKGTDAKTFEIEYAISRVRNLGAAQITTQSRRLHQYRPEWLDQLEAHYRINPGKPLIHLSDLPGKTAIHLSERGLSILADLWKTIRQRYSAKEAKSLGLENIYSCAVAKYYGYITIESLFRAREHVSFDIDQLEPCVLRVKCHKNNWPKEIEPKLPFNFFNAEGAAILGYYTDSKHGNCTFTNKDQQLHDLMKRAVEHVIGRMRVNTGIYPDISETNWSLLMPTLLNLAGINTKLRQKVANNATPLWLFSSPSNVASAYLRALWTAEGMARFMRLVQTVAVPQLEPYRNLISRKPRVTPYNNLPPDAKEIVNQHPSLLLASAALLQRSFGMETTLKPSVAYSDFRKELTVLWTSEITSAGEISKFSKLVGFDSETKQQLLFYRLNRQSSHPPFSMLDHLKQRSESSLKLP